MKLLQITKLNKILKEDIEKNIFQVKRASSERVNNRFKLATLGDAAKDSENGVSRCRAVRKSRFFGYGRILAFKTF